MKRSDIEIRLREMQDKYCDLVWYARTPADAVKDGNVSMPGAVRIQMKHPDECARLAGKDGQWEHGFNSGCLAAFRFALGLMGNATDVQMAEDDFPFLDT